MEIRKNSLIMRVVQHWDRLSRVWGIFPYISRNVFFIPWNFQECVRQTIEWVILNLFRFKTLLGKMPAFNFHVFFDYRKNSRANLLLQKIEKDHSIFYTIDSYLKSQSLSCKPCVSVCHVMVLILHSTLKSIFTDSGWESLA